MDQYDVIRLGLIMAVQAEIEGMKAHNQQCEIAGKEPGYNQQHFDQMAEQIRTIVYKHNDQLWKRDLLKGRG